jgi:HD-GYP domain-containing protein (c-di-GMP phosphodiesterase class II)
VLAVPVIFLVARRIANQLDVLKAQATAIRRFDFKSDIPLRTRIVEIHALGSAMHQMKDTIQTFLDVSIALAAERNFERLMDRVLEELGKAAGADGGVLYLHEEADAVLRYSSQRWSASGTPVAKAHADLAFASVAHPVIAAARGPHEPSVRRVAHPRPRGLEYLDARYGEASVDMVVVPLLGRAGNLVGVLCSFVAPGSPAPTRERMDLVRAFAGAAAVAIDQQRLLQAEKRLLNSFIGLTALAIDAKSPYTGGHCQRVPELTEMLARAAHDATDGPFAAFKLGDDEWEALRIAAWLHDCGKVTTPEYVVDKATKLETIYDRIHEVRMRFEVMKRDAEIAALKAAAGGGDAQAIREKLAKDLRDLDDEFAFVAASNEGGEFMSPERVERLQRIARRTWQRTLDNRLGVSWEERQRMEREPAAALPATERLLADKPEHIVARGERDLMPEDNPWGFKLTTPAHLYNRGELHNLSIGRGTLSEEERYKINDHIVQTIVMLSQLPFPRHLGNVTELAGGHHEKMDGTGYPRRLRREDMSVQARLMAVADIFEALTASDRPYKKGKKLSEAIRIMAAMVKDRHIDADLFRLFLESGVYRRYAEKYLEAQYIDEVDIASFLAVLPEEGRGEAPVRS